MPTQDLGTADEIEVNSDEKGFELWFSTEHGNYCVNVHGVSESLLDQVRDKIGRYWQYGRSVGTVRPVTDDDAYPPNDPKRSSWHSVHADLYDDERQGQR